MQAIEQALAQAAVSDPSAISSTSSTSSTSATSGVSSTGSTAAANATDGSTPPPPPAIGDDASVGKDIHKLKHDLFAALKSASGSDSTSSTSGASGSYGSDLSSGLQNLISQLQRHGRLVVVRELGIAARFPAATGAEPGRSVDGVRGRGQQHQRL